MSGEILDGYRLERLLGRGTMGAVYLARRTDGNGGEGNGREVAIKRLHTLATTDDRDRLRREAQTMARLDHPHVLRLLAVIDDGDGIALVMPYAPNGTLATRLADGGPLPVGELVAMLAPIADALGSAHRSGVVHRDVKPSNILIDAQGRALLSDFGISRNAAHTNLTRTDVALGTAAYLDPELADGAGASATSDQYALGVVAYEALTGAPPFTGSTPLAVVRAADRGSYARLDRDLFGPLADVVERAFARNPADRFASVEAFAAAIRAPAAIRGPASPAAAEASAGASADATQSFRRRVRPETMDAAPPIEAAGHRRRNIAIATAVVTVLGIGVGLRIRAASGSLGSLRVHALPSCDPQTTAQCVRSYTQTGRGVRVAFTGGDTVEYVAGQPGDVLRIANWFCGSRATLALYRPTTGVVYYVSGWPSPGAPPVEVAADRTGIRDAQVGVGDHDRNGCADIALERDRTRTWYLPSKQPQRLQASGLADALGASAAVDVPSSAPVDEAASAAVDVPSSAPVDEAASSVGSAPTSEGDGA